MASSSEILAGRAAIEVMAHDNTAGGLASAMSRIQKFSSVAKNVGVGLTGAGSAIFAPLAASAAAFANHGAAVEQGSRKTGLSADAYSTLGYASKQVGVGSETMDAGFAKMSRTLAQAAEGGKAATESLSHLGLTVADLSHLSQEDRFKLIADRLKNVQDPALRAADAMAIFGRGASDLLPLLTLGSAGIEQMQAHTKTLGLQWSGEDAAAAGKFSRVLKDMWDVLSTGVDVVGSAVAPVFSRMAQVVTEVAIVATQWVREHKEMIQVAAMVALKVAAVGSAFVIAATVIGAVGTVAATAFGIVAAAIAAILSPITWVIAAVAAAAAYFLYFSNVGSIVGNAIMGVWKQIYDAIAFVFQNTSTLAQAWTAAMTIGGTYVMQTWANVKGYLVNLWTGFSSFMSQVWDNIGAGILENAYKNSEAFQEIWSHAMHGWASIVNATADIIQKTFLYTSNGALKRTLDTIDSGEKSGKLTHAQADQQRHIAYKDMGGYDDTQRAARDKANDDQLKKNIDSAKAEFDAKKAALDQIVQAQSEARAQQTAADKAATDKQTADAIAAQKAALEKYEDELKKAHEASGQPSLADHFKALTNIDAPPLPDLPNESDLGAAAGKATSHGAFNVSSSALAAEIFGGDSNKEGKKTNEHLASIKQIISGMASDIGDSGLRVA